MCFETVKWCSLVGMDGLERSGSGADEIDVFVFCTLRRSVCFSRWKRSERGSGGKSSLILAWQICLGVCGGFGTEESSQRR